MTSESAKTLQCASNVRSSSGFVLSWCALTQYAEKEARHCLVSCISLIMLKYEETCSLIPGHMSELVALTAEMSSQYNGGESFKAVWLYLINACRRYSADNIL
eukprot:10182324-Ditylum_brightwellii.AAC.1